MGEADIINRIRSIEPNIGFPTGEPSLNEMVFLYYRKHFDAEEAIENATSYFMELGKRAEKLTHDNDAQVAGPMK